MTTMPADISGGTPGTREFLAVVFKHQVAILATFLAVVLTVAVGTLWMAPTYEVSSRLLVKFGRENIYRSEVGDEQNQIVAANIEEILNSEVGILTSRDLATDVVSTMTLATLYPDLVTTADRQASALREGTDRFVQALAVDAVRKSSIIEVTLQHNKPEVATRALNLLLDKFKDKHIQAYSDPKSSYLEGQLNSYEQRLAQSQVALESFKQRTGAFSLEEQRTLLLKQRADLATSLNEATSRTLEIRQGLASLGQQLRTVDADVPLSTENERYRSIDDAKKSLLELQLREQDLLRQYTERNQLVVSVRQELAIVQDFIKRQEADIKHRLRTGQNVVYQAVQTSLLKLQAELPAQEARTASGRSQLALLDADIRALDQGENELEDLKRTLSINDTNYRAYQGRLETARTLDDLNRQKSANVSIIEAPSIPTKPVKPRALLNMGLAAILGVLAGLGVAFARELLSQGLSTPESVERRLGLPVLATLMLEK